MQVSTKLAYEIYIILLFHIPTIVILFSFCMYIYLKAKKTPILYSFLSLSSMLLIWMISKVFKTVSPNESIRWFFIVIQYFGIELMGFFLVLFAYIYTKNKLPSKKVTRLLIIIPILSFLIVLTNPIHMRFYSYFDFYKDRFGPLFFPIQGLQYIYLVTGIFILAKNHTSRPLSKRDQVWARFFALVTLIPLSGNLYYILFKLGIVRWIFPIPVFDFSPIAGSAALILFIIPALQFRFFDISLVSHRQIFNQMPTLIVFATEEGYLYSQNRAFEYTFGNELQILTIDNLFQLASSIQNSIAFSNYYREESSPSFVFECKNHHYYRVRQRYINKKNKLLYFSDITTIMVLREDLHKKNSELLNINNELKALSGKAAELSATRIKTAVAQNMHDILGHSLTVALCTADYASNNPDKEKYWKIWNLSTNF